MKKNFHILNQIISPIRNTISWQQSWWYWLNLLVYLQFGSHQPVCALGKSAHKDSHCRSTETQWLVKLS